MMRAATVVPEWWRPLDVALVSAGIVAATLLAIYVTWKGWGAVDQRPVVRAAPATIVPRLPRSASSRCPRSSSASTRMASSIRCDRRR